MQRDVKNHQILDTDQEYRILRADDFEEIENLDNLQNYRVATVTDLLTVAGKTTLTWIDTDPQLVPPYGEKTFWYRLQCVDAHGNVSSPSAAISGRVPDYQPPGPTKMIGAEGFADHIRIYWLANTEEDLAGYLVYRSLCDNGILYTPSPQLIDAEKLPQCDFMLVDTISRKDAEKRLAQTGRMYFDDYSVPDGSPICYAYWVRAYDVAQNLYPGLDGCPASRDEYVCQRLYEETAPPVPVITGLKARDNAVSIEWIASPVQDLHAFHVYRSDTEDEVPYFIGCVLKDGSVLPFQWTGQNPACQEVSAQADPATVRVSFVDRDAEPNHVYWYRVSALDWIGNESEADDIKRIPAVSTFTYSNKLPPSPVILPQQPTASDGCGLVINWSWSANVSETPGFLVFRSTSQFGSFRQISPVINVTSFTDMSARRGIDYWYCIQAIDQLGKLSLPSEPVSFKY